MPPAPSETAPVVLASRSPRRRDLLASALPPGRLRVLPPRDAAEEPLDALTTRDAIEAAMTRIVRAKLADVRAQLDAAGDRWAAVVAADTAVLTGDDGALAALGQPPADGWEAVVRGWFRDRYAGRSFLTLTAVAVAAPDDRTAGAVVATRVHVRADAGEHVDRVVAAGEPVGRAGGFAVGGLAGALCVARVEGGLSNVAGLPLAETLALLAEVGIEV